MTEYEVVEVIRSCQPIYKNLHDKIAHQLTSEETALLEQFKIIWFDELFDYQQLIDKAGMSDDEFAFLGGYIYMLEPQLVT